MKLLANNSIPFALGVALILLVSVDVKAQTPDTISVQIFVTDTLGVPLDSSGASVNVRLFQGPSLRLSKNINGVEFVNGVANLAVDVTDFAVIDEYDLAIFMGGVEFLPRAPLRSVPYALSLRGLIVYPQTDGFYGDVPNLIGGSSANRKRVDVIGGTIGGGGATGQTFHKNEVLAHFGTIGGGLGNQVGADSSDIDAALAAAVLGGRSNKALGLHAGVVAGQFNNGQGSQSFVGGGQSNKVESSRGAIMGGSSNVVRGGNSSIGGGQDNEANGNRSFLGGGRDNMAEGDYSFVGAGRFNRAEGSYSSVAAGRYNAARGTSSFAGGVSAKADHSLSFVWNGSGGLPADSLHSTANAQFIVRANGGLHYWHEDSLVVTADERGLIPGADGAYNLGSQELMWDSLWAYYPPIFISDRNSKSDIEGMDYGLEETLALRPVTYQYKRKPGGRRQMGLIAQETAEVIPEVVVAGAGTMGIQYSALIPLLISAIQDQQKLIDAQSARIEALEAKSLR